jgi:hypothetical protein
VFSGISREVAAENVRGRRVDPTLGIPERGLKIDSATVNFKPAIVVELCDEFIDIAQDPKVSSPGMQALSRDQLLGVQRAAAGCSVNLCRGSTTSFRGRTQ